ncbi:D-tyrosyl-tRNA(Tyr) deacylase [Mariprofundus micogutta]|uniref:D-aminoacyl-tRNA deacylase n=1 Tax=Mariprofundus micogutta TaxID=1921010 RepID=A0A1L8CKA6_9PROT|nr:D-aminoacyl-tRNA deacylase [Mariprofundus micogutta]GAV19342.1 D-tyrosyl-tRNA(Tyr) deacylase [Mariprofundus micogutta]
MRAIIQRVSSAMLVTPATNPKKIGKGIVALIGIEKGDNETSIKRMSERLLGYRIFPDSDGRMNLSISDINGELLLVPNFTVAADTKKGSRAGFSTAAAPDESKRLFSMFIDTVSEAPLRTMSGIFAADMQITLTNDGPVTFILES